MGRLGGAFLLSFIHYYLSFITVHRRIITCTIVTILYLAFLYWVGSWWGLLVLPFIFDVYITKKIPWTWWQKSKNPTVRLVMSWVDAIVFALVAIYFINQFFIQNFVIPSSSLEKTLLTGDYLLVSKMSYGPRIPQTPLSMPLTQHTLPIVNTKSYIETPHWDYRRVAGFGNVELNDIVVFNYPAGDTVALLCQNQDYYRMAYQVGEQILKESPVPMPTPLMSPTMQRDIYEVMYQVGSDYIKQDKQQFGEVVARPTDRRENYVKRCVGLPGQWFSIKNNIIHLDGVPQPEPEHVQYGYFVTLRKPLTESIIRELGITKEDRSHSVDSDGRTMYMPLTKVALERLKTDGFIENIEPAGGAADWLYPQNMAKRWTTADYGPIWIPKRGTVARLTLRTLPIYERCIRAYEGNRLEVRDGKIFINDEETEYYKFKLDYYWMMGDNRDNSADSRFWGFVPEDHIVGKPLFVWISLDPDYGWFDGKFRWERVFKKVSPL